MLRVLQSNIFSIVISCYFLFRIQPSANFRFPTALGWGVKNAHFPLRLPPLRLPFPGWNFLSQWRRKMFLITIIRTKLIVNWNTKIKLRKCRRAQTTNCTFRARPPLGNLPTVISLGALFGGCCVGCLVLFIL